jgi:S1-C subfamily serine protease
VLVADRAWSLAGAGGYGLEPGDIIHSAAGRSVRGIEDLRRTVEGVPAGAPVGLQIERAGTLMFLALERR